MNYNLVEIIRDAEMAYPQKTALIFNNQNYTYKDIWRQICAIAAGMRLNGLQQGDKVVICLGNHINSIAIFFAAQKLGACPSIIAFDTPEEKIKFILNNSGASFFFTSSIIAATLLKYDYFYFSNINLIIDKVENIYAENNLINFDDFISDPISEANIPLQAISVDLASIIYTSGSTGEPKGVMLSHQNMMAATRSLVNYLEYHHDDTVMAVLPIAFDYGLYQIILAFFVGGTVVLESNNTPPPVVLRHIQQYRCTIMPGLSSLYSLLDIYASKGSFDLSSIRLVSNTGMALRKQHVSMIKRLFPTAKIFSMYGLTECKRCTYLPPDDLDRKPDSVGIAIPNTQIMVVDDNNQPCTAGEIGQLLIRGETVMQGYWRNSEATEKRIGIHPIYGDRCLYSGDYGWLDEEGYFYFVGRMDEVAKIRGRKVIFSEIEKVLFGHDSIIEAAVIVHSGEESSEDSIIAFVATQTQEKLLESDLKHFCSNLLELHQIPSVFIQLSRLPKNANGKFDKHQLRQRYQSIIQERFA
ncbi:AMP-binding protein [Photorhabdus laumondii subsp. laumondii]|uniref:Photorhabdus luminescens subsp. laumondii TTO1 complete genome segment 3/17 n=2 Tax=Photorhabdus laumondii subsp. laumondii TaxID=141679 RepID=Q7N8G5_PHOLL|nr:MULTISPECIES: class I adenylate-forming enzyme family protein [Photorhabdus]AWK40703.1 aminopeptidase [Photorhabdus laumondii subsp. laumondii]AXG41516.1 aminopeptidase [Photorhabdus laumondii subsp. laumondii]AXG46039.1 aminopeptidase [Photorhabdus laumondii subsp. laumondii]MCC8388466.1 acyl--CoA ligase [Photorhabdus laumondii]MCC8414781.1 acyl--CoA ligase [Photorhabdus laumondii]